MTDKKKASPKVPTLLGEAALQILNKYNMPLKSAPDHNMANRFFEVLTGGKDEAITFQFFTDNKAAILKGRKDPLARHTHKNRPIDFGFVDKKQAKGCGVWVMVNEGDGKGRSAKNVVKVRALFIDLDGSPWQPAVAALKPHMRVESSPGRWHLYWLVDDCPLGQFKPLQQAIAKKFDGDKSCCDLPRVLRVPGFYHLKNQPVMTTLVEVNDLPRYSTQEIIDGLGLDLTALDKVSGKMKLEQRPSSSSAYVYIDHNTGEEIDLKVWATQNPGFDIVSAIDSKYIMGAVVDGKQHILCPFADEHTDPSPDLATFVASAGADHNSFNIHCMHDHCADRDRLDFLQVMLEKGWLPASVLPPVLLELKKPRWVNFPVAEISQTPEWSILSPEERRIAFDLQYFAWQADGTFDDNDWKIAKFLGVDEDKWLEYRKELTKAGWLIKRDSRLTNEIVKDEFDKAQIAYSQRIASGRRGGLLTQEKRRNKLLHDN